MFDIIIEGSISDFHKDHDKSRNVAEGIQTMNFVSHGCKFEKLHFQKMVNKEASLVLKKGY